MTDTPTTKRPPGRPTGTTMPDTRHHGIVLRLSLKEKMAIVRYAESANLPVSAYVRKRALKQPIK